MTYSEPIWKAWFAKHGGKLLLFARQQARYPDDAEDLVQEAFVRIWRLYGHTGISNMFTQTFHCPLPK